MVRLDNCLMGALGVFLACSVSPFPLAAKDSDSPRLPAHHYQGNGENVAAATIAATTRVVVGFEAVQPKEWSAYNFEFSGGSIADLLDAYTTELPAYEWNEVRDGVYRVIRKEHGVQLADVVINSSGGKRRVRQVLWEDIWAFPEVKGWMSIHQCSHQEIESAFVSERLDRVISLEPGTFTVAELLDQVALASGEYSWSVIRSRAGQPCTISIDVG